MPAISMKVNGQAVCGEVEGRTLLVEFLRDKLGLTGTHVGCDTSQCGACTLLVDGRSVRSCAMLAVQADGLTVDTVEGLSQSGEIADLQAAFHRLNALQCGFCTAGMLLTAQDILATNPAPSRADIREQLSGNYCRCTGYQAIVDAVAEVAVERSGG